MYYTATAFSFVIHHIPHIPPRPITFCVSQCNPELYVGDFVLATNNTGDDQESEFLSQSSRPVTSDASQTHYNHHQRREETIPVSHGAQGEAQPAEMDEDEEVPPSPPGYGAGVRSLVQELDRSRREQARSVPGSTGGV